MATGDPSNWAVVAAGTQVTVDLEGMSAAGISAFESGKACTVNVSAANGYNGTTPVSNKTRTARTRFNAATSLASTVVNDTFTEGVTTALGSHTPDTNVPGNPWVARNGTWDVDTSGNARGSGSSPGGEAWVATIDCGNADVTLTTIIRISTGFTGPGIVFRYSDNNNYWRAILEENTEKILLVKREAGSNTTVAEYMTAGLATSVDYTLVVETSGSSIKVFWSSSEVISVTNSFNSTQTSHGMRASSTNNLFRSWQCEAGSGARVTMDLEDPIHPGETVTADLDVAAFDDGVASSNAASGASVTNNSTLVYPTTVCGIVSKLPDRYTGQFYVEVYACGAAYAGYEANFGIAAVEVTVTDSAGSPHAETLTATAMTLATNQQAYGWQSSYPLFRVGPFDAADFTAGVGSIVAKAYPKIGDAGSVRTGQTQYCYLDPSNAYDTQIANVDCSGTMTLSGGGLSAAVNKFDRVVGGTSGAVAFVNQAYSGGATSISVSYSSGTFTSGEALSIKDDYDDTETATATLSGTPTWNFSDGAGTLGASGTAYRTIIGACNACADGNTGSKGSWSEVRLLDGIWTNQAIVTEACNTSDGPITIGRHSSSTKASVVIVRGAGLNINNIRYHDLTIRPLYGEDYYLRLGSPNTGEGMAGGNTHDIVIDDCEIIGEGRTTAGYFSGLYSSGTKRFTWAAFKITESNLANIATVQRDCTVGPISEDLMKSGTGDKFVINVQAELDASGTANHSDAFQFYTNLVTPDPVVNCGMHNCRVHGAQHQNAPFSGGTAAVASVTSFALTNCVQEEDDGSELAQFGDNPWDSVFIYNSVNIDGTLFRTSSLNLANAFFKRNVWGSISLGPGSPDVPHTGWGDNHFVSAALTRGFDITTGSDTATLFDDYASEDYTPAAGQDLVDRGWTTPITPYDAGGTEVVAARYGYIGAFADNAPLGSGAFAPFITRPPRRGILRTREV